MSIETLPPISPLSFFALTIDIPYGKKGKSLPDMSGFLGEVRFADVDFTWNEKGISLAISMRKPFSEVFYPDYEKGDAFEFFFDTRDLKTAVFTQFCHHFLVLPKEVQGVQVQELTRFRGDETHPLSDGSEIIVDTHFTSRAYTLNVTFPADTLHGYDPLNFDRLGFTYRFHRTGGPPAHFATTSQVQHNPSSWATLKLVR